MLSLTLLATLITATLASPPFAPRELVKRAPASCNRDNLYRCFTASPAQAAPFCTAYVPASTVTASTTVTPSTTITNTVTVTAQASTTAVETQTSTTTISQTDTATNVATVTETTTSTTTTIIFNNKLRRQAAPTPACLTKDGAASTSYPASRISSACSCLYPRSVSTITPTASTTTITSVATASQTVTATITQTVTIPATVSTRTTVTTDVTSTTTSVITATETKCATFTREEEAYKGDKFLMQADTYITGVENINTRWTIDENKCRDQCTDFQGCWYITYKASTNTCQFFADGPACQGKEEGKVSGKRIPRAKS